MKKELTVENVRKVMLDCLFTSDEVVGGNCPENAVIIDGITRKVGFHPERVKNYKQEIEDMLSQLPKEFMKSSGGGMSFLNACMRKDGMQWGEHINVEELFALGQAIGKVTCLVPRDLWQALPGGMPYYVVDDSKTRS